MTTSTDAYAEQDRHAWVLPSVRAAPGRTGPHRRLAKEISKHTSAG